MLHTDIPTRREIETLAAATDPWSVSIYTPTEADVADPDAHRIRFGNQVREALERVTDPAAKSELRQEFDDLIDDEDFWRFQSRSLVVLATPTRLRTYRVPNRLEAAVSVNDRFLLTSLLRAITFPQTAFVLALSEGAVRLVEITGDAPAEEVRVSGLPSSASDYARKASLSGRAPKGRIQGTEGRKLRVRQFARAVDQQLRDVLSGRDVPLILAATEPIDSLFRAENSYHALLAESIPGNPEHTSDDELSARSREVLDRHYADELATLATLFEDRRSQGRGLVDLSDIARAATFGMVDTLLVDIDSSVPGTLAPQDGAVTFDSPATAVEGADVLDEIARRVILTGGRVLAVRSDDVPDKGKAAAILRYAP
ncbi:baeRF11 domain-containing protein [Nocardia jejuensis]|uniref:baeRF11 domain-containing protein n=1 Tax=Nocardia jejuensis TaxID=328049 RepID=UPI00082D34F3|nr:hypothetical protein [Nocardia jejuensis]